MDSRDPENTLSQPLRRSKRHSSVLMAPTPRGPLKRTKKRPANRVPVTAVNGSKDVENGSDDEESPRKKSRLEAGGDVGGSEDQNEMDVQESVEDEEKNEDQEMDIVQDSSHSTHQTKICQDALGDVNLSPRVVLGERCHSSPALNKAKRVKPSKEPVDSIKSTTQIQSPATRHDVIVCKNTNMDYEYRKKMEAKAKSSDTLSANHHFQVRYPGMTTSYVTRRHVNDIPTQKATSQPKKKEGMKNTEHRSSEHSSRGFMWYFWHLVLLVVLSTSAILLAYKIIPVLKKMADGRELPSRAVRAEKFADHLSLLETRFPSQRSELWKRSKIHLEKHLKTAQPTEPVSLIFTAGLRAEKTLHCLAQALAAAFSSPLNASVLHIDGASKVREDSDEVKLDIDSQLMAAFEGDKPVAVVHRFEELPPGSTLIFYRYCDHENAAYKRVFLLFTVLLPVDEVSSKLSLKEVEEMVQDHVKEKLVGSSNQNAFNKMDLDKYSGLWSRISHLILPVVFEKEVEERGC